MRAEHVVASIILMLVVLLALLLFSANIVPAFKEGITNLAASIGIKVGQP
mgnify:CR=1 FL=1